MVVAASAWLLRDTASFRSVGSIDAPEAPIMGAACPNYVTPRDAMMVAISDVPRSVKQHRKFAHFTRNRR